MAAGAVGLAHQTAYRLRRRDPTFACAWDAALVLARDCAEQVLAERAIDGVEEIVFYRGEEIGRRRRFDARLLLAHLARLDARADDPVAARHAGRFDDLLGAIGEGLALEPMVDERARALASGAEDTPGLVFPQLDRAMFVSDELFRERVDAYDLGDEEAGDEEAGDEAGDEAEDEAGADEPCDPVWQGACDRARIAAPWDAGFAANCAAVDALIGDKTIGGDEEEAPPREYKSLGVQDRVTFGTFGGIGTFGISGLNSPTPLNPFVLSLLKDCSCSSGCITGPTRTRTVRRQAQHERDGVKWLSSSGVLGRGRGKRAGSGPDRLGRKAHQDRVDIAAGLQAEQRAPVVDQVEFRIAPAPFELLQLVGG